MEIESGGNENKINFEGKHARQGAFQISEDYYADSGMGNNYDDDCYGFGSKDSSAEVVELYMRKYATRLRLGRDPTDEDIARIHNGGPDGWKKDSTRSYWQKVKMILARKDEEKVGRRTLNRGNGNTIGTSNVAETLIAQAMTIIGRITNEVNVTFFSKTGNGKSSTASTIMWTLGSEKEFKSDYSLRSVTTTPTTETVKKGNVTVRLTDQPGIFDTEGRDEQLMREMAKKNTEELKNRGGFHCVFLIMNAAAPRMTILEEIVVEIIKEFFSDLKDHMAVIYTHGDALREGADEKKLLLEMKEKVWRKIGFEPAHSLCITNIGDRTTNKGWDRKMSGAMILTTISAIMTKTKGSKAKPKKVPVKEIQKVVNQKLKDYKGKRLDIDKIFAAIEKVIPIIKLLGANGGCTLL
eukprot:CAMPEP_0184483222 /NCGR_PEP_ID=MMETSP0113_2-20130426/4867_1 /TAXON_ID=91329 /ORGANISM="Norrisiella sphaerica, Strain BC52" /LENGTH=409 /DNA_ID=CAMNT_0026863491 /DNA_START=39 /DNA_END=1268 /DNA_ORIENTATION=-